MYYYKLLQITITKSHKLNTTIIYTKVTNNDHIKQFFKKFDNDDTKKGFLMMILKSLERFLNNGTKTVLQVLQ